MSLLSMVQAASDRIGVVKPTAVTTSSDQNIRQFHGLASQEVKELARAHDWQAIVKEHTWTATATETQADAFPTSGEFDRFIPGTMYNRDRNRIVSGPLTPQEWQDLKGRAATVVYDAFRQRGGSLIFMPIPQAGQVYAYEYVSKYGVTSADGLTGRASFTTDNDVSVLDEELITLGIVWRFLRIKGMDYGEAFRTYEQEKRKLMARDGNQRGAHMGKRGGMGPRYPLFPDASWDV